MTVLYYADTDFLCDTNVFNKLYKEANPERRSKINALKRPEDKKLSLGVEALLKYAFERNGFDYSKTLFSRDANGKPYAVNRDIFFSLSHSKNRVACALSNGNIGCDAEFIGKCDFRLAKRFYSDLEYSRISSLKTEEERTLEFYKIWTAKESYLKAIGTGMRVPFNSFCVPHNSETPISSADGGNYYIYNRIENGYSMSVCSVFSISPSFEYVSFD